MATKRKAKPKAKPAAYTKPQSIDEYLARLPSDQRAALQKVRKTILSFAPGIEEHISYQIPAFRWNGKWLVYFGASTKHLAIYGLPDIKLAELADYDTSGRGTIRFTPNKPLPASLLEKLLKAQVARLAALHKPKPTRAAKKQR